MVVTTLLRSVTGLVLVFGKAIYSLKNAGVTSNATLSQFDV